MINYVHYHVNFVITFTYIDHHVQYYCFFDNVCVHHHVNIVLPLFDIICLPLMCVLFTSGVTVTVLVCQ